MLEYWNVGEKNRKENLIKAQWQIGLL